jgi:uncharacterized protein
MEFPALAASGPVGKRRRRHLLDEQSAGHRRRQPLFVSLNPPFAPAEDKTFGKFMCEHPHYNRAAFAAQKQLADIQGRRHTWFCGAWTGYGFHEDGLRSGLAVAEALGAHAPWREPPAELAQAAE